ncbi:MAG: GTPase HflX [Gemmatimonadota bacterium]|nr:MAG: GTPase HflX [Gemmatimonadota bacterium]
MGKRRERSAENADHRRELREQRRQEAAEKRAKRGEVRDVRKIDGEEVALVVGVRLPEMTRQEAEESLGELASLAVATGARVVGSALQSRARVDGRTFLGAGKAEELKEEAERLGANLILIDHDLSPAQGRNLEKILDLKILDRTELILDIFARRARTPQARLQVEVAQLEYLLPRLTRLWEHLSRTGGGIGTRGPGETQLEVDRRRIRDRLTHLKSRLKREGRRQEVRRTGDDGVFRVALVGYTNTGKSTLMNRMTTAQVAQRDRLFETLDATTRVLDLGAGYRATLTDTVGFIRRLPHGLVESFRATLAEVAQADLLLHVRDASDPLAEQHRESVVSVLREIGADEIPELVVYNKADLLPAEARVGFARRLQDQDEGSVLVSAHRSEGLDDLLGGIRRHLSADWVEVEGTIPAGEGEVLARLRAHAELLEEETTDSGIRMRVRMAPEWWSRLQASYGELVPDFFDPPTARTGG